LLAFLKKKLQVEGLTGVSLHPDGIAMAHIVRTDNKTPVLIFCDFHVCRSEGDLPSALATLVDEHHLANAQCVSVLDSGSHNLLLIEAPDVEPTELKAAVRWRVKDLIDFHIDDAVIDVFEIPGQTVAGRARLMYVVAVKNSVIQKYVNLVQDSELELSVIDIPELALRNITAMLPEDEAGVAFLVLNSSGGMIALTRQSTLYLTRNIDVEMQSVFNAAQASDLDNPQLQGFFERIALETQRSLDYYESHFAQPPITQLVISPMEKNIPGLVDYVASNLGVSVRVLDLNAVMKCEHALSDQQQSQCLLAIGGALRLEQKTL